jgi:putative protease
LGNTDFIVKNIEISMDDDIFLPISEIKEVRRTFIEMTEKVLLEQFERAEELHLPQTESLPKTNAKQRCGVTASVWNEKQFSTVVESTLVEDVVLELAQFSKKQIQNCIQKAKTKGKRIFLALPYVFRQKDEQYFAKEYSEVLRNVSGVLIRNIEEYFYIREFNCDLEIRFDYNVYRMNDYASAYMKELQVYNTIPVELNSKEIRQLHCENSEMILYGYIPLMISAGCGLKTLNQCDKKNQRYQLRDRKGNMFTVQCVCNYCYNLMLNCKALSLFKFAEEISSMNISSVRLSFTIENEREVREVLEKAQKALIHHQKILEDENTTRGHYTRGVL